MLQAIPSFFVVMHFNCVVGEKAAAKHAVIEAVRRNIINADREERNIAFIFEKLPGLNNTQLRGLLWFMVGGVAPTTFKQRHDVDVASLLGRQSRACEII